MPVEKMHSNNIVDQDKIQFSFVPVVDVTRDNFSTFEPTIRSAIEHCDYIAIDCELSGLGDRKKLNASSIEERFTNSSVVAKTRSIIALGLSIFKEEFHQKDEGQAVTSKKLQVQTYNIVVLCSEDYIVEPGSVKFLVGHGFNFNQQYSEGVPYYRGNDKEGASEEDDRLRNLFKEIVRNKKKVVFHNGFIDIVFLYQNFYAQLPQTLQAFLADLCEMFPNGIYDTKYIADYVCRIPSSFLEFVFKKLLKVNMQRASKALTHVEIKFPPYPDNYKCVEHIRCTPTQERSIDDESQPVCQDFANHGNCKNNECQNSHDVDYILAVQEDKQQSKKKKKRKNCDKGASNFTEDNAMQDNVTNGENNSIKVQSDTNTVAGHRAGMDAFMTGYSYAAFIWHKAKNVENDIVIAEELQDTNIVNNMYLVCKEFPLLIKKSAFAKNSVSHVEKYEMIMKQSDSQ